MLLSPFITVLRLYAESRRMDPDNILKVLLQSIIKECTILKPDTHVSSLDVLALSLKDFQDGEASDILYEFLDNCVLRFVRKPVKYYDILTTLSDDHNSGQIDSRKIDLLLIVILEQWPFLVKSTTASNTVNVAKWLARYLDLSIPAGGNLVLLSQIRDGLETEAKDKDCRAILRKALEDPDESRNLSELGSIGPSTCIIQNQDHDQNKLAPGAPNVFASPENILLSEPPEEDEDHAGLRKWAQEDVQDAIRDGSVDDLIFCLCSKHEEIRKQAQSALRTFMAKLEVCRTSLFLSLG